jgi:hypothetical protein
VEAGKLAAPAAAQQLQHVQDKSSLQLSARSQQLLALAGDAQAQQQFAVNSSGQAAAGSLSCITCMDAVRQAKDEVRNAAQTLKRTLSTACCTAQAGSPPRLASTSASSCVLHCYSAAE